MSAPVYSSSGAHGQRRCARSPSLWVYSSEKALAGGAAEHIVQLVAEAIALRGRCVLALAGGNTPRPIYRQLAAPVFRGRVDWSRVQVLFGDERCVPPEDVRSNYAMARAELLDQVPIPSTNIHRIHGEAAPERAAADYERVLKKLLGADGRAAQGHSRTEIDLALLGLGEDGHTASLFPGLTAATETRRWAVAEYVPSVQMWRVTLTPVVFNAARNVAFLVAGAAKAHILHQVLEGPQRPLQWPAQTIKPTHGALRWLTELSAASGLRGLR